MIALAALLGLSLAVTAYFMPENVAKIMDPDYSPGRSSRIA